jgi:hypothetical protein
MPAKQKKSKVRKRPCNDSQAGSRDHNDFERNPPTQHRDQDAGKQAPASPVSRPGEGGCLADGDLIAPGRHEKSKAICSVDELQLSRRN